MKKKPKPKHKHKWKHVGGCEIWAGGIIGYVRYRCKCGALGLRRIVYGHYDEWIRLKRGETFDQHELP